MTASTRPTAAPASSPPAIPAPTGRRLILPASPFASVSWSPADLTSERARASGTSGLRELQIELALVPGHPDATRGELVQVLGLPVQEAALLEVLHVARDRIEGETEALRQDIARVQVRRVRRGVIDLAVRQ